tara:strand:- start:36 stop:557 length:522 start_codon:yes stop_codon:yes gene_type:complete
MNLFTVKVFISLYFISNVLFSHPVVENLDIERFMGRWYVFALIPNWIEEGGTNSYDDYVLNEDGTIDITYKTIKDGKQRTIKQQGFVVDNQLPSRWEIKFIKPWVPFYKAPYEVIILDKEYSYMVVGHPDNTYGWIMSRETSIDEQIYNKILLELNEDFGYNKDEFQKVIHNN